MIKEEHNGPTLLTTSRLKMTTNTISKAPHVTMKKNMFSYVLLQNKLPRCTVKFERKKYLFRNMQFV